MKRVSVESAARFVITAAVGGIGAAAGFTHTHDAAVRAGQLGWLAFADAVVIECMVIVAGFQLARERKAGRKGRVPLIVLVIAFLVQMGAQVSGAPGTFAGWLFAAIPALGCLVCVKFNFRPQDQATEPTEEPPASPLRTAEQPRSTVEHPTTAERVREIPASVPAETVAPAVPAWPPVSA